MERSNEVESSKPPEARKNASETLAIGFNFESDWLRSWCEIRKLITNACSDHFRPSIKISQFSRGKPCTQFCLSVS